MECSWKMNCEESKKRFSDWWGRKGLVLNPVGMPRIERPHESVPEPEPARSVEASYTDPVWRARRNHHELANRSFPAENLPISDADIGPGSLALFLGSEPGFSRETVWFYPCMKDDEHLEERPPLSFDPSNRWWRITEATLLECAKLGRGRYMVGCPDLIENIDILAALREPQTLLMDMLERPEWVSQKVDEINAVWFEVYDRIYDIIKGDDGGAAFNAFQLWGPGKTAKVQCDASAMFSPEMFERFVAPALTRQCEWLDYSMFHLDGHQCICHLETLLSIKALGAIEWTPDPQVPSGGSPHWYDMYRRILDAGKAVQAVGVKPSEVEPLLDAVGGKGMYVIVSVSTQKQVDELVRVAERFR